ncbi:MAG: ABC transporter permease [Bacteroidales bacterium]|jgi:ABC-type lipoprotein release transport system permease subunit|nr:ABC transporter permease [Bacteroidales bacterium]
MKLKLAWKNLWRNRRRTLITVASVFFALFFSIVMNGYMDGMWGQMIANTLKTQSGHIEIHGTDWWDDKTVDNFMTMDSLAIQELRSLSNVENVSPRIETFALASFGNVSKGVALVAVSPSQENAKSKLSSRVIEGKYLAESDNGVLIGAGLAKYLKVSVGDTLAFIGQGYQGSSAAGLFPVHGILQLAITEMDNSLVYATLPAIQTFIDMPDGYSGILITLKDDRSLDETMETINSTLHSKDYEVMNWHFTMKRLLQTAESDKAFSKFVLFILYVIVGFGILGTVIMLTNERKREFRMLVSLGMQRGRLVATLCLELLIMSLLSVVSGIAIALPLVFYFHSHPIQITGEMAEMFNDLGMEAVIPFSVEPKIFVTQVVIVIILTAIAAIYPIRKIKILKLTEQ